MDIDKEERERQIDSRIEELESSIRTLSQDLEYAGAQISELIKMYSQLDAKIVGKERELGWTGY